MQLWQYRLLVTARLRYMFRTLSASIIRSTKNCSSSRWSWVGMIYIQEGHPYWIYIIPTMTCTSGCYYSFSTPDDGRRKRPKHVE